MSQRIRALEHHVGVRLLQRTTRSVGLTEAGMRFLAPLRPERSTAGSLLAYVMTSVVTEHLATKRLTRVLARFCQPWPGFYLYYPSRSHIAPKLQALVDTLRLR